MRSSLLCLIFCLFLTAAPAGAQNKKDAAIEPTHWGRVSGQVYDAVTGAPLADASVSIRTDATFPDKGRTVGRTDTVGRYRAEAMLGRVSSNLDVGRLLNTGLIGLLVGGAENQTKRVDITRLPLRVVREGYVPYEGIVPCRSVDPRAFSVAMEPILLVPARSAEVSTVADGWGVVRLEGLAVEPAILAPGAKATVTVRVACPPLPKPQEVKVAFVSGFSRSADMKLQPGAPVGSLVFVGEFTAPRDKRLRVSALRAFVRECPVDIAEYARQRETLVQMIPVETERPAAEIRAEAFRLRTAGENVDAAARLTTLSEMPQATVWDLEQLAEVRTLLHDDPGAVAARRKAWEMTPEKERISQAGKLASALTASGQSATAIREFSPMVESIKERDRPKRVPAGLMLALGEAYLREGQIDRAGAVSDALLKWPELETSTEASEFRTRLRLAQARERAKASPDSVPARADLARVLMDQGRWEEAVDELKVAASKDDAPPAVRRDLAYALSHIRGGVSTAVVDLDAAIAAAERQAEFTEGKKTIKSMDFFTWHTLGILLYTKAQRQPAADAAATLARSRYAFGEALRYGRSGAAVNDGRFTIFLGYTSPRVTAISGFAYPEANADFVLMESLALLAKQPDDVLANFALGTALLDLEQPALAEAPIQRALEARPDYTEARFAQALVSLRLGRRSEALSGLRSVVKANPRHPRAHPMLARLYEESGDTPSAAASLAEHARFYGSPR